jgi:membrane associated rhomboid family serine protease
VFASNSREACAERALVLIALGIDAQLTFDARRYTLRVAPENAERARAELAQYELEIERRARPPEPAASRPARRPEAWLGCALYALTLLAVAIAIGRGIGRLDAFDVGELNGARVQAGQWWRAWTALTLHLDAEHLLANLAGGIWFGYLAAGELGAGHAWFLGVSAAGAANLLEALLGPASHRAVGASTLVFSLLGLLSAHAWRMRSGLTQRWALQWAPLVGGLMLLAWTGTGGNDVSQAIAQTGGQVDVVAHLLGFAAGALLGWLAALPRLAARVARVPQWLSGLAAVGWMGIAWGLALHS